MAGEKEKFIYKDIHRYTYDPESQGQDDREISLNGKPIVISVHAIKRALEREIAFPDQVYSVLRTGKVSRFGKNRIRFVKRSGNGSIICIGEDVGQAIIIKTVERGN